VTKQKLLVIVVGENDRFEDLPLYEAITRKLVQLHTPGATVQRGIMGFGSHQRRLHRQQLFGISDDRPVTISVVHQEEALRSAIIPAIRPMMRHGLMYMAEIEVIPPTTSDSSPSRS